jgi:cellulose synthase/poly-beta-1,6-N-acetylglucosamine synthase-like glycosyltransferase
MNQETAAAAVPYEPAGPALVLLVGDTAASYQMATGLERAGVNIVSAASGHDALEQLPDLAPDLVVVGHGTTRERAGRDMVRQLRSWPGRRPPVVVIGRPEGVDTDAAPGNADAQAVAGEEYLPADLGVAELVDQICVKLNRPPAAAGSHRPAVTEQRLGEEISRELQRAELARRPGVLAVVNVAELPRLRERLGPHAEQAVAAAFDELFALDGQVLEQHSARSGGGFWLLMPETDQAAARDRLVKLSRRVAGTVLDVAGEHVRMTPVIGYILFAQATSARELCDRADTAWQEAYVHLDLIPVGFSAELNAPAVSIARSDRLLRLIERLRSPIQILFTTALLLSLPFIIYVAVWYAGFDLTKVTYPLMAAALAFTAAIIWTESFRALGAIELPAGISGAPPAATAIVAAYLPNEAATIADTVTHLLRQDYPGTFQVILAYNTPQRLPIEDTLEELAARDARLLLLRVESSTSKAQNVNAALAYVRGEFVGIFDADHHPAQGSFSRAWRWLSDGYDVVQGHCVVRNGDASWVARMVAVEFEVIYGVSHPGRARLHGFGIFGGSNGYWRRDVFRQIRLQRSMLTEDIDSTMRSLRDGFKIVSDPGLISTELAPTTMGALWGQRMRWAQGWTQNARRHLGPALTADRLSGRQKLGAGFLLGWAQIMPWVSLQVIPILAFTAWRDDGLGHLDWLIPLFVLLSVFTVTVGGAQTIFAYMLGDARIRRHRAWFVMYAIHSMLWFGELKNIIARVAQLKEASGDRVWRVTPRAAAAAADADQPEPPAVRAR